MQYETSKFFNEILLSFRNLTVKLFSGDALWLSVWKHPFLVKNNSQLDPTKSPVGVCFQWTGILRNWLPFANEASKLNFNRIRPFDKLKVNVKSQMEWFLQVQFTGNNQVTKKRHNNGIPNMYQINDQHSSAGREHYILITHLFRLNIKSALCGWLAGHRGTQQHYILQLPDRCVFVWPDEGIKVPQTAKTRGKLNGYINKHANPLRLGMNSS